MSKARRPRPSFSTDEKIESARTPPGWVYDDPDVLTHLRETVFKQSWQWLEAEPKTLPGVRPLSLLPGYLDEPLVLTTDTKGAVRCLSNVCTHRGHLVCLADGDTESMRCRYHGRRFEADGRLRSAPGFEGATSFPSASDDLAELPLGRLGPMTFASVEAPALDFERWIAPVRQRLPWFDFEALRLDPDRSRDWEFDANWALYCDNFLEGFHIPYVHAGLNEAIEFGAYRTELFEHGSLQIGVAKESEDAFEQPPDESDDGESREERVAAFYFWLFPNTMLNVYPWGISLNQVIPLTASRSRVLFRSYVGDAGLLARGLGADLDTVELEDEAVVEATQRGVRSRLYDRGRYSPEHERAVHHFHRMLARVISAAGS